MKDKVVICFCGGRLAGRWITVCPNPECSTPVEPWASAARLKAKDN